ncbi:MAG: hypothetical protein EON92_08865 [Burkholderiales bacterium]|nr:MAG: hypothetical protein EON92_08865 [Burkholderiales bacterium]
MWWAGLTGSSSIASRSESVHVHHSKIGTPFGDKQMNRSSTISTGTARLRFGLWLAVAALLTACGGGGDPAPVPPVITQQPTNISVPAGQSATFSVALQDSSGAAYQWLRDSDVIAGADQSSYTLASPQLADSNSRFAVRVSNAGGTVTSAEALLTVTPPPAPSGEISLVVRNLGNALDLAIDAQGNTIAVLGKFSNRPQNPDPASLAVVARKFAPDGSELPYGPDGQGLPLPGLAPHSNAFGPHYTGAALAASGGIYVSTVSLRQTGMFNTYEADGGSLSLVAPNGQVTVVADWPAGSAGAVAPASVTLGPDGALYFVDYISGHLMKRSSAGVVSSVGDVQVKQGKYFYDSRFVWIAVESADVAYVITGTWSYTYPVLKRVQAGVVTVLAGNTTYGPGIDGTGAAASFDAPRGLSLSNDGALYVADGPLLRKVTRAGVVTTVAGQLGSDVLTPGPLPGSLGQLRAMVIGPDGVIQVISQAAAPQPERSLVKIRLR